MSIPQSTPQSTTQPSVDDARARLLTHFSTTAPTQQAAKWNELYQANFKPWDRGFPSPALTDLLASRPDILPSPSSAGKKRRALVPGCGLGYDVLLLSACGYDAWGLDTSALAIEEARRVEGELGRGLGAAGDGKEGGVYETREGVERGRVRWVEGEFFAEDFGLGELGGLEGGFDLIYDYTFLSALPPSLRPQWSKRCSELLAPGGRLVCLEFPTYKAPSSGGPPWALPPKIYMAHLPRPGEELAYGEDGSLLEDQLGEPSGNGLRRIEHFQPKRTHEIGYNEQGEVTDWVGIWVHAKSS